MRFRIVLYSILLLPTAVGAQTLQGTVRDANTQKPLFPVTVMNIVTRQLAYTDLNGNYTIPANTGDVIAFSYIGYKTVEKFKPLSVILATQNIIMVQKEYLLDEILFRPGHYTQYQLDSIDRAETYKIPLQRRPPSPFMSPASAIAEKFSRKAKRTYEFQKDFARIEAEKFIDTRYTPTLVTSLTGLTGDSIGHFMYAYPMDFAFARAATALELKMWIRDSYRSWLKSIADSAKLK